jgi:hypothetical protein
MLDAITSGRQQGSKSSENLPLGIAAGRQAAP